MGIMSVEVPSVEELLTMTEPACYGDDVSSEGTRGGALHLSSVLPAVSNAIGYPMPTAVHPDPKRLQGALGIPDATSVVVALVDGLGYWNLNMRLGHAPYLRALMNDTANQRPIATCMPSTTVAAMSTFGTGTCPGMTGMTGYTQLNPKTDEICQLISFRNAIPPLELQQQPTIFERLSAQDVRVTSSGLPKFAFSALTQAALRGSDYISNDDPRKRIAAAAQAAKTPGLTYLYLRDTDKVGHNYGWDSDKWIGTYERVDAQLGLLRRSVPKGTLIVIVADHGMITTDPESVIDIAQDQRLMQGVAHVGGEPRCVMLYAEQGENPEDIATRWRSVLEDRAQVRTRSQAMDEGVYGPVEARVEPMIGDVIVSAAKAVTIVDSRTQAEKAMHLPSVHHARIRHSLLDRRGLTSVAKQDFVPAWHGGTSGTPLRFGGVLAMRVKCLVLVRHVRSRLRRGWNGIACVGVCCAGCIGSCSRVLRSARQRQVGCDGWRVRRVRRVGFIRHAADWRDRNGRRCRGTGRRHGRLGRVPCGHRLLDTRRPCGISGKIQ